MSARVFRCNVRNDGTGSLEWVDGRLEHGAWTIAPMQGGSRVEPGEIVSFECVSERDLPVDGESLRGTRGWVLFRSYGSESFGEVHEEFVRIEWDVPYWTTADDRTTCTVTRFDPRKAPPAGGFDDETVQPPSISVQRDARVLAEDCFRIQDVPWNLVLTWPAPVGASSLHEARVRADLVVGGTVSADSTRPRPAAGNRRFFSGSGRRSLHPLARTTPEAWEGEWGGTHVVASIRCGRRGRLHVVVTERGEQAEPRVVRSFDVRVRSSLAATGSVPLRAEASMPGTTPEAGESAPKLGADSVRLDNDATLDFYRVAIDGESPTLALRYRRPASRRHRTTTPQDEVLYFRPAPR